MQKEENAITEKAGSLDKERSEKRVEMGNLRGEWQELYHVIRL
jgi:hypothetical protein